MRPPRLPAVSLFTNCGAGDVGYSRAGFRFQVLAELESRRVEVAELNHPGAESVVGDLRVTWPDVVAAYRRKHCDTPPALLAACPPCQGMSSAKSGRGLASDADAGTRDGRNLLVDVVATVAAELEPRMVVVENVLAFLTRKVRHPETRRPITAARLLIERLDSAYESFGLTTDLADFGVPQTRRRAFLVLVRRGEPGLTRLVRRGLTPFPRATHGPGCERPHVTLHEALAALGAPSLDSADSATAGIGLHAVPIWDPQRRFMVKSIPPGRGGSAWNNNICQRCGQVEASPDDAACPQCGGTLARPIVQDATGYRLIRGFRNSSYRRMYPDRPAATITTASGRMGSDYTLHPTETRVLSMLECQHLQTFPADFNWGDHLSAYGHTSLREMIGEAVPPQFTEAHGIVLRSVLEGRAPRSAMLASDRRVKAAAAKLAEG